MWRFAPMVINHMKSLMLTYLNVLRLSTGNQSVDVVLFHFNLLASVFLNKILLWERTWYTICSFIMFLCSFSLPISWYSSFCLFKYSSRSFFPLLISFSNSLAFFFWIFIFSLFCSFLTKQRNTLLHHIRFVSSFFPPIHHLTVSLIHSITSSVKKERKIQFRLSSCHILEFYPLGIVYNWWSH